jgi:hypothetical protein
MGRMLSLYPRILCKKAILNDDRPMMNRIIPMSIMKKKGLQNSLKLSRDVFSWGKR